VILAKSIALLLLFSVLGCFCWKVRKEKQKAARDSYYEADYEDAAYAAVGHGLMLWAVGSILLMVLYFVFFV
jgi:hypothetical protein